ncbi:hypothetical protein BDV93DRAFT_516310 [Ceratobasidium sp. AG-I]|nr:hypothetical protein BDV93DRAFT_516310 [Ceratobasidium sp. AG-I]
MVVATKFNCQMEQNRLLPPELQGNHQNNYDFTLLQRGRAREAYCPTTLEDLGVAIRLSHQLAKLTVGLNNVVVDSQKEGEGHKFSGKHLGVWDTMSKSGKTAKPYDHPQEFVGLAEGLDEHHFYHCPLPQFNASVSQILRPVLLKLRAHIPGLIDQHEALRDSLCPAFCLGSTLFCMMVLDGQPASRAH